MASFTLFASLIVAILALIISSNVSSIPDKFTAKKFVPPNITTSFQFSNALSESVQYLNGQIENPTAFAIGSLNRMYTLNSAGYLWEFDIESNRSKKQFYIGGAPLGMTSYQNVQLLYTQPNLGLFLFDQNHRTMQLILNMVEDKPLMFANQIKSLSDGTIYLTDSTTLPTRVDKNGIYETDRTKVLDILSAHGTGRVIEFNIQQKFAKVLKEGLLFPSGLAVSKGEDFLLVTEEGKYSIHKYWLKGSKKGQWEVIDDNLPGFPEKINNASDGGFWVSMSKPRSKLLDAVHPYPSIKTLIANFQLRLLNIGIIDYPMVAKLDSKGKVQKVYLDRSNDEAPITDVFEHENMLIMPSKENHVRVLEVNKMLKV